MNSRIMGVKSNEVADAHVPQFFQGKSTVQGFPAVSLMLSALIEERHDDIDPMRFAVAGRDDSL